MPFQRRLSFFLTEIKEQFIYRLRTKNFSGAYVSAKTSTLLKVTNIIAFALTILINSLAGSTTLIGGKTTADISNLNPTLITPAGYVFAIWGIIYLLLGVFVVYQALPSQKEKDFHDKISWLFILTSVLNITWLFLWQNQFLLTSVVVMFLLLASLIAIYLRLNIGKSTAPLHEKLAVQVPFSVYLGWITIASIANVAAFLVSVNWDGFGISRETWAILIIAVALLITLVRHLHEERRSLRARYRLGAYWYRSESSGKPEHRHDSRSKRRHSYIDTGSSATLLQAKKEIDMH